MSRSSSEADLYGPSSSARGPGRMFDSPHVRSISLQHDPKVQGYRDDIAPETSGAFDDRLKTQDAGYLETLHGELLGDNLRLWECVNIIRCNPRLKASSVLRQVYSQVDQEFFKNYPTYANFAESGHGALGSTAEGGGARNTEKYPQHLRVHNNGMMRENTRLMLALDILDHEPTRTADEALCHAFAMSDDIFVSKYPDAMRGSRLRAALAKLRDDERRRQRSSSLPGYLHNPPFGRFFGTNVDHRESGPSCSNNNETFPYQLSPRDYAAARAGNLQPFAEALRREFPYERGRESDLYDRRRCSIFDRSQGELDARPGSGEMHRVGETRGGKRSRDRGRGSTGDRSPKKPMWSGKGRGASSTAKEQERDTSPRCGRKLKTTTSDSRSPNSSDRKTSPRCRHLRSKSERAKRTPPRERSLEDTRVPYMLTQHPYNWTTCNRSGNHYRTHSPNEGGYYDNEGIFHPEEDEQGSVLYRKHWSSSSGQDYLPPMGIRGQSVGSRERSARDQESRISYSTSPAAEARHVPILATNINTSTHNNGASWTSVASGISPLKSLKSPKMRKQGSASNCHSLPGNKSRSSGSGSPRKTSVPKRSASGVSSSRKGQPQDANGSYCGIQRSPDKKRVEKNVTFERRGNNRASPRLWNNARSSGGSSPPARLPSRETIMAGNARPMYYKPPSEKTRPWSSEDDEIEDHKASRRLHSTDYDLDSRYRRFLPSVLTPLLQESGGLPSPRDIQHFEDDAEYFGFDTRIPYVRGLDPFCRRSPAEVGDVNRSISPDSLDRNLPLESRNVAVDGRMYIDRPPSIFSRPSSLTDPTLMFPPAHDTSLCDLRYRPAPQVERKPSVASAPSSFTSVSQQAKRQSKGTRPAPVDLIPIPNSTIAPLHERKPHRVPTKRQVSPQLVKKYRTQEWIKNTSQVSPSNRARLLSTSQLWAHHAQPRTQAVDCGQNENANRIPHSSSSVSRSDVDNVMAQDDLERREWQREEMRDRMGEIGHSHSTNLLFLERLLTLDNKMEQLLKEKRDLDQRYGRQILARHPRRSHSAPPVHSPTSHKPNVDLPLFPRPATVSPPTRGPSPGARRDKNCSACIADPLYEPDDTRVDDHVSMKERRSPCSRTTSGRSSSDLANRVARHSALFSDGTEERKTKERLASAKTKRYRQDRFEERRLKECASNTQRQSREAVILDTTPRSVCSRSILDRSPRRSLSFEDPQILLATGSRPTKLLGNCDINYSARTSRSFEQKERASSSTPLSAKQNSSSNATSQSYDDFCTRAPGRRTLDSQDALHESSLFLQPRNVNDSSSDLFPMSSTPTRSKQYKDNANYNAVEAGSSFTKNREAFDYVNHGTAATALCRYTGDDLDNPTVDVDSFGKAQPPLSSPRTRADDHPVRGQSLAERQPACQAQSRNDQVEVDYQCGGRSQSAETCSSPFEQLMDNTKKLREEMQKCRERRHRRSSEGSQCNSKDTSNNSLSFRHAKETPSDSSSSKRSSKRCKSFRHQARASKLAHEYLGNMHSDGGAVKGDKQLRQNKNTNSCCGCPTGPRQFVDDSWQMTVFPPTHCAHPPARKMSVEEDGSDDLESECGGECDLSYETRRAVDVLTRQAETSLRLTKDAPPQLLGELAFQLERRIIKHVFDSCGRNRYSSSSSSDDDDVSSNDDDSYKRHRFYGYTVVSLPEKIRFDCRDPTTGARDNVREARLLRRFQTIVAFLRDTFGYHVHKHGRLCQDLIKKYGVFGSPPDVATIGRLGLHDFRSVRNHVIKLSKPQERPELLVLVDCLHTLGQRENKPVLWFN